MNLKKAVEYICGYCFMYFRVGFFALFEKFYLAPRRKIFKTSAFCFSVCSDLEFKEVANRLRDWFKALHESRIQNKKTRIVQRPERTSKRFLLVLLMFSLILFCT